MNNQEDLLLVTSSPHAHSPDNVPAAMRDVLIALSPALVAALYFFRLPRSLSSSPAWQAPTPPSISASR